MRRGQGEALGALRSADGTAQIIEIQAPRDFAPVPTRAAGMGLSGRELSVLIAIASCRNRKTGLSYPGLGRIAETVGISRTNVSKLTAKLEFAGLLTKHRLRGNRVLYEVLFDPRERDAAVVADNYRVSSAATTAHGAAIVADDYSASFPGTKAVIVSDYQTDNRTEQRTEIPPPRARGMLSIGTSRISSKTGNGSLDTCRASISRPT